MVQADVASAAIAQRLKFQRPVTSQETAFPQILSQRGLNDRRQRRGNILGLRVLFHRFGKVIRQRNRASLHGNNVSPTGEVGDLANKKRI